MNTISLTWIKTDNAVETWTAYFGESYFSIYLCSPGYWADWTPDFGYLHGLSDKSDTLEEAISKCEYAAYEILVDALAA